MKHLTFYLLTLALFFSCTSPLSEVAESDDGGNQDLSGLITAGEWNDLENWDFWTNLQNNDTFSIHQEYWGIYPNERIAISVNSSGNPIKGAKIELMKGGVVEDQTYTDNLGNASFFLDLFETGSSNVEDYSLRIENNNINEPLVSMEQGINEIEFSQNTVVENKVQLSFIVDATGSMGDELRFLREDLKSVIERAQINASGFQFETSAVYYRDEEEDFLTRVSEFSTDIDQTIDFIGDQTAAGGGDFPEAVHSAMEEALNLEWDENAHTKIAFLVLDAPPHYRMDVLEEIRSYIDEAKVKGIKLIPISASGIDKETEFLLRYMSIITNGTYVFITDDSGIGNDHLPPSVGEFEVEFLNDLMVRLIKKYTD